MPMQAPSALGTMTPFQLLKELKGLLDVGVLSQEEFDAQKAIILLQA